MKIVLQINQGVRKVILRNLNCESLYMYALPEESLKNVYLGINLWVLLFIEVFAYHSVCTTVAWVTGRWVKFVYEVGSTIFNWNCDCIFATGRTITKADLPFNFTIFHCRMSINQLPWPIGTTSVCWHTCCWHFCTSRPHKTIPSLRELAVTQLRTVRCYVTYLSISITQVFIMIAAIGCKVK